MGVYSQIIVYKVQVLKKEYECTVLYSNNYVLTAMLQTNDK